MFTGIIEEVGKVVAFARCESAWRLQIAAEVVPADVKLGDSVAVNGCCLTVVEHGAGRLGFDVLEETKRLTGFGELQPGSAVNLERSLQPLGRMGGHFVSGHVDALGRVEVFEPRGKDHYLKVRVPEGCGRYLVYKGSIALDGISLTVAETEGDTLAVWLIPHTMVATNLHEKRVGSGINLEFDLLGKYVEKLLASGLRPGA
ncbi:MAG: riboflavin synthase [Candidatus Didemnitutus sp.]|nr:riboflavin synthase [Candidatus Didemnitutus sp.]